jgi:hypothetical protein
MQTRGARAQRLDDARAEARSAAGRRNHQRAMNAEPRSLVGHPRDRAGREHEPLRRRVMDEGCGHVPIGRQNADTSAIIDASGPRST